MEKVVKEEMEEIDITDEEIEEEWLKLQFNTSKKEKNTKRLFKKIAALIIGSILTIAMLNIFSVEESIAGKRGPLEQIITTLDNILVLNRESTLVEAGDNVVKDSPLSIERIEGTIEDAREIIRFNFRELPLELDTLLIEIHGNNREIIELNYLYGETKIRVTQYVQGIEHSANINVTADSTVEELTIGGIDYTVVKITDNYTSVFGYYFGVNITLDINGSINTDEIIEILKAME